MPKVRTDLDKNMASKGFLRPQVIARYFGCSLSTITRHIEGSGPKPTHCMMGNLKWYEWRAVRKIMNSTDGAKGLGLADIFEAPNDAVGILEFAQRALKE